LRFVSIILLLLTALLVGLDRQTKTLLHIFTRTADYKSLDALYDVVWIDTAGAAYCLLQLVRICKLPSNLNAAWGIYFFDLIAAYVIFAGNVAALQASILALTGESSFQWMKQCDTYKRFCVEIGVALFFGISAGISMAVTSSISGYHLFRLYSPTKFLSLKPR
ncbi:hypothetical protein M569_00863, partial [Genlisea aurea]